MAYALYHILYHIMYGCMCSQMYDVIRGGDQFGQMMKKNIASRGCPLRSIDDYPDISDQCSRFLAHGFQQCRACDMDDAYESLTTGDDKLRISRLEMLDEFEEWHMLMRHYILLCATVDRRGGLGSWVHSVSGNIPVASH